MGEEIVVGNPGQRTKAYRLRAKVKEGDSLSGEEAAWLSDYEAAQRREGPTAQARTAAKSRKLTHIEEESESASEAIAPPGSVAFVAASAAVAREEGRRLDFLASAGLSAFQAAFDRVLKMNQQLLDRNQSLEEAHVQLINAVTKGHMDLTAAQIETMQIEAEADANGSDSVAGMVKQFLPGVLEQMAARQKSHK
jgi:hypothetical protein